MNEIVKWLEQPGAFALVTATILQAIYFNHVLNNNLFGFEAATKEY